MIESQNDKINKNNENNAHSSMCIKNYLNSRYRVFVLFDFFSKAVCM